MVSARPIATLPSTWSRLPYLSIISLPDGVKCWPVGTVKPWVHDSGLYLVHVKELQLRVWLHVMDSGKWLLQNTICLHEVGIDVLYIHTRSRNAEKVYTVKPEEEEEPWIRLIAFVVSVSWKRIARGVKKEEEKKTDYTDRSKNDTMFQAQADLFPDEYRSRMQMPCFDIKVNVMI
ncbi:hypothetical protein EJB05_54454, partial [Eragrostis curvula]